MNPKQSSRSVSPARRRAYDILFRVEMERAYASVLAAALAEPNLSREDRALAQEIVLGVLRWQRSLDYFIERYSGRPINRFDLPVLIALRIGLYQLRFLDRIPQSAAVNESVNLVKRARAASAGGLVNAVLRKAASNLAEKAGEGIADPLERASVELSHPRWMLERWQAALGDEETRQLALANNAPAPTAFRVNTLRTTVNQAITQLKAEGVMTRESELAPGAFIAESGPSSIIAQAAQRGLIYVQDQASQLVSILLDPRSGHRVLDLCAAPGSKSSHIATLTEGKAWVIACDRHPQRLNSLRATCQRLGIDSVDALALDATEMLPFEEGAQKFDRVLVDAPCSGTGTLRGNPEIKWRLSPDDITRLSKLQLSLLERAASSVGSAGRLVYSTCSMEREENEEVVYRFLQSGAPFRALKPTARSDVITSDSFVRTFPHRQGTDGFFAAVLEKVRS
ncbi:MAG: 16S rRNA (cytosine(967)-C(5))-methyltransferase RsmB [Acidobacteriota bacterium]